MATGTVRYGGTGHRSHTYVGSAQHTGARHSVAVFLRRWPSLTRHTPHARPDYGLCLSPSAPTLMLMSRGTTRDDHDHVHDEATVCSSAPPEASGPELQNDSLISPYTMNYLLCWEGGTSYRYLTGVPGWYYLLFPRNTMLYVFIPTSL